MLKKALKKLTQVASRHREKPTPQEKHPPTRVLTAEGWKRLMMKKQRKG